VRAWLVDLDGTLYRARYVRLTMAAELMLGNWRAMRTLRAFRQEHERLRHELSEPVDSPFCLQMERTARRLGTSTGGLQLLVENWMIRRPGKWLRWFRRRELLEQIDRFHRAGGRTAVVSDYPASAKLISLGARDLFDCVVSSGEPGGPGRLKPWPDGLLLAADRLGVKPRECLVLGDRPDADGEAARRAGMGFLHIK
jgi:FMN phosphatase YigB (HAD superfamily)